MFGHPDDNSNNIGQGTSDAAVSDNMLGHHDTAAPLPNPAPSEPTPSAPPISDSVDNLIASEQAASEPDDSAVGSSDTPSIKPGPSDDELLKIKQQALQQLSPLVGHLDQTPEEKFRTTMMLIQAADNQALLKEAYEAAQDIPDEKIRAQALLDVVNEINYFTQQHENDQHAA